MLGDQLKETTDIRERVLGELVTSLRHAIHQGLLVFWGRVSTPRIPRRPWSYGYLRGIGSGTISRRMSWRGQLLPQLVRGQLEELPEAQVRELQAQQAVGGLILAT